MPLPRLDLGLECLASALLSLPRLPCWAGENYLTNITEYHDHVNDAGT